ncbi:sensor histidine kinase [Parafrankia sp. FMc2]|uniref:sensor histidine kinase n=1 Tax=Parafrankia sp. FMc2 TaxID=3233196 RepID=UPI0034D3EF03
MRGIARIHHALDNASRALVARRTWTQVLYVLISVPLAAAGFVWVLATLALSAVLTLTPLGLWLLALTLRGARVLGNLHRALAAVLLGDRIAAPPPPAGRSPLAWRRAILTDASQWQAVGYLLLKLPVATLICAVTVAVWANGGLLLSYPVLRTTNGPTVVEADGTVRHGFSIGGFHLDTWPGMLLVTAAGAIVFLLAPWVVSRVLVVDRFLLRALLGTNQRSDRVRELERTRAQAVDDATATLRRIERDLHDGTQARLVALGISLTMAKDTLRGEADDASFRQTRELIDSAHQQARDTLVELRDLARGIRPPVLDQGLLAALATLTSGCALPVDLHTNIPRRPAPAIEMIAYFCVTELLTNAVRHSGAQRVRVDARLHDEMLWILVADDGAGGATLGAGSGLIGLRERLSTVDGDLKIKSPAGGPTTVTLRLPNHS